jgi:hypothetical protein
MGSITEWIYRHPDAQGEEWFHFYGENRNPGFRGSDW